ncbi:ATP-NAD kinase [Leucosporidium creatinivorum]|uniref:ATP-NAD kinase n=1 Tax=Leucosporidium creatinivorum TaxID=106004 RepID=A0A1Y2F403_9BASI|nr:ATP-NAD kinase [Leucosporidium creatinivorum]
MLSRGSRAARCSGLVRLFSSTTALQGRPFAVSQLPAPKAEIEVGAMGRFAKLAPPRRGRSVVQRVGSTYGGTHTLTWVTPARTMLLLVKRNDARALLAAAKMIKYIQASRPELCIVVEPEVYGELRESFQLIPLQPSDIPTLSSRIDFVVALGGDGTLLRVSSLFDAGAVPPVLGVSAGTLGFMTPIHLEAFPQAFEELIESRSAMLLRMRIQCVVSEDGRMSSPTEEDTVHAMNEVTIHRGPSSHLIYMNVGVDGQHLTEAVADGLLVSTPTGSTAYSLSAGGPIVHPSVQSLLLTAISPRSLSFRTVLLPSDVSVDLTLAPRSRSVAQLSLDGRDERPLLPSQSLQISMSPYPVPCISPPLSRLPSSAGKPKNERDAWIEDIRRMLRFNAPFQEGRLVDGG